MSSREHQNPNRYDFKCGHGDYEVVSLQRINSEFGQYVSFDTHWNLLCEFSEYEESQQEEEQ